MASSVHTKTMVYATVHKGYGQRISYVRATIIGQTLDPLKLQLLYPNLLRLTELKHEKTEELFCTTVLCGGRAKIQDWSVNKEGTPLSNLHTMIT
ncbi:hypothetical protein TNIN_345021 [Trichonephila inaurata madagascariensis]|uniref:Uncharacterized protein n=1 Tax=Trichonephila inaurata madagascariensis TaxID=2747483 RepID=A0A8X7CF98_9ARAC|nr:hypothetical protein TNIN_345021 [Trichonephila inaurata madagascariensis]